MKVVSNLWSADSKIIFYFAFCAMLLALCAFAQAQQAKIYRIGVITSGGGWYATIDGLRAGLKELGVQEGKQFILTIRDTKGDARAAEAAAKVFEQEKVDLIFTTQTSVSIAAKRATRDISIVFCAGADPIDLGLVDSFANRGEGSQASTSRAPTLPPNAWKV